VPTALNKSDIIRGRHRSQAMPRVFASRRTRAGRPRPIWRAHVRLHAAVFGLGNRICDVISNLGPPESFRLFCEPVVGHQGPALDIIRNAQGTPPPVQRADHSLPAAVCTISALGPTPRARYPHQSLSRQQLHAVLAYGLRDMVTIYTVDLRSPRQRAQTPSEASCACIGSWRPSHLLPISGTSHSEHISVRDSRHRPPLSPSPAALVTGQEAPCTCVGTWIG
jgi:hypothetical protein